MWMHAVYGCRCSGLFYDPFIWMDVTYLGFLSSRLRKSSCLLAPSSRCNFAMETSFKMTRREELADRLQGQLGQMHVVPAFVKPDAFDNEEEEQEEKKGAQPTDRRRLKYVCRV
ncbi:uncharacterized protein LOC144082976 isoform X2 [Stigmatopora argus]